MNIVIPMAGRGQRFADAGYTVPKPLIRLAGTPLYIYSSLCLPLSLAERVIYTVLQPEWPNHDIRGEVRKYSRTCEVDVVKLAAPTSGQSETVLLSLSAQSADLSLPLLIFNCDSCFTGSFDWRQLQARAELDGALVCFKSNEPRYSYASLNSEGYVERVAEKVVISDNASTGAYYFSKTSDFMAAAAKRLSGKRSEAGEYYVAPLYNDLIAQGKHYAVLNCDRFICYGTPAELKEVEKSPEDLAILKGLLQSSV